MKPIGIFFATIWLVWLGRALAAEVPLDIEPRFRTYVGECDRLEGGTGEAGRVARMEVYVNGKEVRLIRWRAELPAYVVTRDYYLIKGELSLVPEHVTTRPGGISDPAQKVPQDISFVRIRPGGSTYDTGSGAESWADLKKNVATLLAYFEAHRADFKPVTGK